MSIGTTYESSLLQAAINDAWDAGKVLVAAAANSNTSDKYYPAAHEHVVAVAALNKTGEKAGFSNYGDWVDISAYGTGIYSTCFDDVYVYMSGTSMACPLVSGCCALMFAFDSTLTNDRCVEVLISYVDDVYETNPAYLGQLGTGCVNPFKALEGLAHSRPGDINDGESDGTYSGNQLVLGPETQG
jgi:subtilisin family serine protease